MKTTIVSSRTSFSLRDLLADMGIADMDVDILMGARASCNTVGVTYGNGTREELVKSGADYIIDDMTELVSIIEIISPSCTASD